MEKLGESLKKLLLIGIGTAAVTAEKSKEVLDDLVKKGELTVEQGKVLNKETEAQYQRDIEGQCECFCESIHARRIADPS